MTTSQALQDCGGTDPEKVLESAVSGAVQDDFFEDIAADAAVMADRLRGKPAHSGKGRQLGSKNRSNKDLVRYVRARGVDPVLAWVEICEMTPQQVLKAFAFKDLASAVQFQFDVQKQLAKIMYPGQSLADMFKDAGDHGVQVVGFMAAAHASAPDVRAHVTGSGEGEARTFLSADYKPEQNQELSGDDHE